MDPEKILNLLLGLLPLDLPTVKFIRELFNLIRSSFKNSFSSTDLLKIKPTSREVEDIAAKLCEVIAYFNSSDKERDEFIDIFPRWEVNRQENIQKLREIAESMQDSRQIASIAQIVGASVGIGGGLAIIGSVLFPPAAPALLPAWLGGAAATALVPSFLLPAAATAVTSSLAVGGTIAAGAGSVAQVVTSITEVTLLSSQIDKAKDICRQDKESYDRMMRWFERTQKLKNALDNLFKINVFDIIFTDLKNFFGQCDLQSMAFKSALQSCVRKIFGKGLFNPCFDIAVTAITFAVFLVQRRNRFLFQWIKVGFGLVAAFNAGPQFGRLLASTIVKDAHLIPKALASKVAVGALAGIGIALDVTNIVLNSIDLAEGSKSEEQKKVIEVAGHLESNLDFIREVNQNLLNAAKKASEDFLNSLIVDQLNVSGTVTIIAHEVYQDVLKKNRKLRRSRNFYEMDPCFSNLRRVIDIFNEADEERVFFSKYFCQWEIKRKENITNLYLIAEYLQDIKTLGNTAQYVGVTEGIAGIGAGMLQYLIDTFNVTYKTVINYSNATRLIAQLRKQTEETMRICRQDRDDFIKMESWFRRIHKLNIAFYKLFGEGMFDTIFDDLKVFCGGGLHEYRTSTALSSYYDFYGRSHQDALESFVRKICVHNPEINAFQEAAIASIFAMLLDERPSLDILKCFNVTHHSKFGRLIFEDHIWDFRNDSVHPEFTKYTDEEEAVLQNLEKCSVEGRVVLLGTVSTVWKLANRNEAEISALVGELQGELDSITDVWLQLF